MSKSNLVIDTPIQVCQKCKLCYECENDNYMCAVEGKIIPDGEKPDWFPLRDLPNKTSVGIEVCIGNKTDCVKSYVDGYNTCIDEILKGANGNE